MVSKGLLIGVIVVIVSIGIFGFYSTTASSTNDSSLISFESISDVVFSSYSINSKCDMYNVYIDVAKDYDDLDSSFKAFSGVTEAEMWEVLGKAQEKFYDFDPEEYKGGLGPNVDQGLVNQYILDISLDIMTERSMITNDINPDLKNDVRKFMGLYAEPKKLVSVINEASLVC